MRETFWGTGGRVWIQGWIGVEVEALECGRQGLQVSVNVIALEYLRAPASKQYAASSLHLYITTRLVTTC